MRLLRQHFSEVPRGENLKKKLRRSVTVTFPRGYNTSNGHLEVN